MKKKAFARYVGISETYASQLSRPWAPAKPGLDLACRIAIVTGHYITPFDLAGISPDELVSESLSKASPPGS
jgi:hypothetical protein